MFRYAIAIMATLGVINGASAEKFDTGHDLEVACRGAVEIIEKEASLVGSDGFRVGACVGYIKGTIDTISTLYPPKDKWLCLPNIMTPTKTIKEVIQYVESNPKSRQYPAARLVVMTMWKNWRCPAKTRQ